MNQKLTLVVLAAGMGSRYGGKKQTDPVGPGGEILMEYSLYDAMRAGFDQVVFLIRREMASEFETEYGRRVSRRLKTAYAFQDRDAFVPEGFVFPQGRVKPWGTAHAVLCCRDAVDGPFAMINADDYYGPQAFARMAALLRETDCTATPMQFSMIGYPLGNTLTENGAVARGVCAVKDGMLTGVTERTHIFRGPEGPVVSLGNGEPDQKLPADTLVSMNFWGFTPQIFGELERRFPAFLESAVRADPLGAELYIPNEVGALLAEGRAQVRVQDSPDRWYGVTYRADKPSVVSAIAGMIASGLYPADLWA